MTGLQMMTNHKAAHTSAYFICPSPQTGQHLWDLGSGSGSIAIEWLLSTSMKATSVEKNSIRAENIYLNAAKLGVDWIEVIESDIMDALSELDRPDADFIGGGFSAGSFEKIWKIIPAGTRLVVNGVTIETDRLIVDAQKILVVNYYVLSIRNKADWWEK